MNLLVLELNEYDPDCFYFLETEKNVLMDGLFTKMIYTQQNFTMNGLYYYFPIQYSTVEPCGDKYYIHFDPSLAANKAIIEIIYKLETQVLLHYASFTNRRKLSSMTMHKQLLKGKVRIHEPCPPLSENSSEYILKISGVWETDAEFGVTYKWLEANSMI